VKRTIVILLLGLTAASFGSACAADEPHSVGQKVSQLESVWAAKSPSAQYEYFVRAGEIASDLFRQEPEAARGAALVLLKNLLAKQSSSPEVGATDLIARTKVARFVLDNPVTDDPQMRYAQLETLKSLLLGIRREAIRDYVPQPTYLNLPAAADAHVNQKNNLANSRQAQLQSMDRELSQPILEQAAREAIARTVAADVAKELLQDSQTTASEKAELQRALHRGGPTASR